MKLQNAARVSLALAFALGIQWPAEARAVQVLNARYATRSGPSDWVQTDVTFLTGQELNSLTHTLDYSAFSKYAVVFFTTHEAAVIEMESNYSSCGGQASLSCVWGGNSQSYTTLSGTDKGGRMWEFCAPENYSCR